MQNSIATATAKAAQIFINQIDGQLRIKLRLYNYFNVLLFSFSTKICFYLEELAQTSATTTTKQ